MADVKLLCRGKGYNGQSIEPGIWDTVGPFEVAKMIDGYVFWAHEGTGDMYVWRIETHSGEEILQGEVSAVLGAGGEDDVIWASIDHTCHVADQKFIEYLQKNLSGTTEQCKMVELKAALDGLETEDLISLLQNGIAESRQEAKLSHVLGDISDRELRWNLGYADRLEGIAKKLFPGWE